MKKTLFITGPILIVILVAISIVFITIPKVQAKTPNLVPVYSIEYKSVDRTRVLEKFLEKYNSPLIANAKTFVATADRYGLDYKLLPAISCMESLCGKMLIPESYNPFGWGGGLIYFDSYDTAIENVGKGLEEIYLARGLNTPEKIAPVYAPPNYQNWLRGIYSFMNQMDTIALEI